MAGAPYELNIELSDDASYEFTLEWVMANGDPFPWTDYSIEYAVDDGRLVSLSTGSGGITIDTTANTVTFAWAGGQLLSADETYEHSCHVRDVETGKATAVFSGTLTIAESAFASRSAGTPIAAAAVGWDYNLNIAPDTSYDWNA